MAGRKYITVAGDTWDLMAYLLYGDEKYMQKLIRANWDLLDVIVFGPNQEINVPSISVEESNKIEQPEWRSVTSDGDDLFSVQDLEVTADG